MANATTWTGATAAGKANLESTLGAQGLPKSQANQIADSVSQAGSGSESALAEHGGAPDLDAEESTASL